MFINELFESDSRRVLVIYPGRFQPPHKGHAAVFQHLIKTYGTENVFICTSDKVDPPRSPFNFKEKQQMWALAGVSADKVKFDAQPYQAKGLVANYDATNTVLLFAISEKDMAEDPRFAFKPKKDGSPSYFQAFTNINDAQTLDKHAYMITVPTFDFEVLGKPANSATQIRAQFASADEETQKRIVTDLFGRFSPDVLRLMQEKLQVQPVDEASGYVPGTIVKMSGYNTPLPSETKKTGADRDAEHKAEWQRVRAEVKKKEDEQKIKDDEIIRAVRAKSVAKQKQSSSVKEGMFESNNLTTLSEVREHFRNKFWHYAESNFIRQYPTIGGRTRGYDNLSESTEYNEILPLITKIQDLGVTNIAVGDQLSLLDLDIVFASKYIELRGFTQPKSVADIEYEQTGKLRRIHFNDGTAYPQVQPAAYNGRPVEYFIFFDGNKAEKALTYLLMSLPKEWELDKSDLSLTESVSKKVTEDIADIALSNPDAKIRSLANAVVQMKRQLSKLNGVQESEITETVVHTTQLGNIVIHIDDHYLERAKLRNVTHKEVGLVLTKLKNINEELNAIEPGQQFWVQDDALQVSLGMRKRMDINGTMQLLLKTVVRGPTHQQGANPIIAVE